jgi:ribosomal protein S27AE
MPDKVKFTDEQLEQVISNYYAQANSQCPNCNARLNIVCGEARQLPKWFSIDCPRCKSGGQIADKKYLNNRQWTVEEEKAIEDAYWENKSALCPIDNSVLVIQERSFAESAKGYLSAACSRCGNALDTKKERLP